MSTFSSSVQRIGDGVFVRLPGNIFEYHGGLLSARVEDNGSSCGSHEGFNFHLHTPHAGAAEPQEVDRNFSIQGRGEVAEFFQLMQALGRALGYLKDGGVDGGRF